MPYKVGQGFTKYGQWQSYSQATYDVNTGYALANVDFRTHVLYTHGYWGYFFEPIQDTIYEAVSEYNLTTSVNMDSYIASMYPANGTVTYNSTNTETIDYTTTEVNVSVIFGLSTVALIFLVLAIFFVCAYYKSKKEGESNPEAR
jgi:hypothetical protein